MGNTCTPEECCQRMMQENEIRIDRSNFKKYNCFNNVRDQPGQTEAVSHQRIKSIRKDLHESRKPSTGNMNKGGVM